ncbi:ceramide synthase 4a isoform X4 [Acanthopagrus latus]|uniref:ceramide synthase 4a isoform X4 n=1 Tax=Acanthopagrus latus TaxID=8177 RepID=UPI00187C78FB|nr:ceramide synthase 4a isoform X4 [Acanthopagrus latus]
MKSQAHRRPIKQIFRCEGPGSDSSRIHPKAGDLLQTQQSATIAKRGGELVEAVWTLPEKDPDLVQTAKEPGPPQQHQKVLRSLAPWFWDHSECWRGYPKQPVAEAHHWYYILEMGFYLSLLLCVSVDVKRKDFKEQVIHHIATIFLIGFSYCANFVRVGTLVMLLHDSSDFLLESAKMLHYAGWWRTCDSLFVVFALVFLVTRLVVFPGRVLYSTLLVSQEFFKPFGGYVFFNALLLVLQALHIFWAYLILRMVYKFVFMGKVERDERSDVESEVEDEEEEPEEEGDERSWEQRKGSINSKLASLANNCVLNNLTNQRNINSRLPKAR